MKLVFSFLVILFTFFFGRTQNLVDITVGGSYAFTNTFNVISTNYNGTGEGIGWSANLYTDAEMGPSNDLLSLRWMIDYAATTSGSSFLMTDVSIYLFEYGANSVFPNEDIPDLIANGAVNVFQGDLTFTPPASNPPTHCEAEVTFSVPFTYTAGNSLVVYVEKTTPYNFGSLSPYYGYMPGATGLRVLSNWSGTVANPILPVANNSNEDRYALIKFNETNPNLCLTSPCVAGVVSNDEVLCSGNNTATLSIGNPNGLDLQWQVLNAGLWEDISGANSETLTVNNIQTTTQYQVLVSGSSCSTVSSDIITVNVINSPPPPEIDVVTQPICPSTTGSVSFVNLPSPENWTITGNPSGSVSGTSSTGTISNLNPGSYFFSITVGTCSSSETINPIVIVSPQTPTPAVTNNNYTVCIEDDQTVDDLPVSFSNTPIISLEIGGTISTAFLTDTLVTGLYYVSQIDNANGCNQSDSVSINVVVEQSPTPQIPNNNVQLCESDSITLGGLGATGNGGILNFFFWDGASIIAVAESELAVTGTYYVTQTGPGNSCESIDSLEINISVTGLLAPTTNNSSPVLCVIDDLLVGDLDVNGNSPTYFFNNGSSTVPVSTNDSLEQGEYIIIDIDPLTGCQSGDSLSISVTLNDPMAPTTLNNTPTFCETDTPTINDLVVDGSNINWYDINGVSLTSNTNLTTNTTYFATQTIGTPPCESATFLEMSITILNTPPPTTSQTIQVFCEDENAALQDIDIIGSDITWYDAPLNGTIIDPTTLLINGQTLYASQSINGCESIALLEIAIVIQTAIDGGFNASGTSGCAPFDVVLIANFNTSDTDVIYSWLIDGVEAGNSPSLNYTFENQGCYDIQLDINSTDYCQSSAEALDYVCVFPEPISQFTANPNVLTSPTQLVSFTNQSVNSSQYIWDFGNGNNSSNTNPDYSITINNDFLEVFLTAISDEGCENTSSLILTLNETYDLYVPNTFTPDSDEHNQTWGPVFLEGFDKFNFQLLVFNRWGEIVWESKDADARWDGTYSKSPYMCPDGIYTWKILYKQKDTDEKITRTGHVTIMR